MRIISVLGGILLSAGCAPPCDLAVVMFRDVPDRNAPRSNLVLGNDPLPVAVAQALPPRSAWPSAWNGYRFDDVATHVEIFLDDQFIYDRYNNVYRGAQSFRTRTLIR